MPAKTRTAKGRGAKGKGTAVQSVVPCLAFPERAEEAVHYYVGTFRNSRVKELVRYDQDGPLPKGALMHATFTLNGQEFTAMDGGPTFTFSPGFSMVATVKTQKELDAVWARLADGGQEGPCGWLTDRFGVSWQVVPEALVQMLSRPDKGNAAATMDAMFKMSKLDIKTLKEAYKRR